MSEACRHELMDYGGGGMGDAFTCRQCGLSKYAEALPILVKAKILTGMIKVVKIGTDIQLGRTDMLDKDPSLGIP